MDEQERLPTEVPAELPVEKEEPRLKDRRQPYGIGEAKRRIVPNETA